MKPAVKIKKNMRQTQKHEDTLCGKLMKKTAEKMYILNEDS
jgi:hypothetical protein